MVLAAALGLAADDRARVLAEWVLSDEKEDVRAAAAHKLVNDPDPKTVQALVSALKDDK